MAISDVGTNVAVDLGAIAVLGFFLRRDLQVRYYKLIT